MSDKTGKLIMEVTGHNRESAGRVVHYLRPVGSPEGSIEIHGGIIVTDDKGILPDGKQFEVTSTYTPVKGS